MKYTLNEIIELAKDIEAEDPIDWSTLPLEKDSIYQLLGSQAYELYNQHGDEDNQAILLATVIKLVVENFILNLQIPGNNVPN